MQETCLFFRLLLYSQSIFFPKVSAAFLEITALIRTHRSYCVLEHAGSSLLLVLAQTLKGCVLAVRQSTGLCLGRTKVSVQGKENFSLGKSKGVKFILYLLICIFHARSYCIQLPHCCFMHTKLQVEAQSNHLALLSAVILRKSFRKVKAYQNSKDSCSCMIL